MPRAVQPKGFGAPLGMYSHGMVVPGGEIVVVAGQVGMGPDGQVAVDNVVAQTKQALENVRAIVEAAGCTMRDVVRLQTFLTRAEDIAGFMKARSELFPGYFPDAVYPPNTLLVVSRLVRPELLIEIEAMAVKRQEAASPARPAGGPAPSATASRKAQLRRPTRRSTPERASRPRRHR